MQSIQLNLSRLLLTGLFGIGFCVHTYSQEAFELFPKVQLHLGLSISQNVRLEGFESFDISDRDSRLTDTLSEGRVFLDLNDAGDVRPVFIKAGLAYTFLDRHQAMLELDFGGSENTITRTAILLGWGYHLVHKVKWQVTFVPKVGYAGYRYDLGNTDLVFDSKETVELDDGVFTGGDDIDLVFRALSYEVGLRNTIRLKKTMSLYAEVGLSGFATLKKFIDIDSSILEGESDDDTYELELAFDDPAIYVPGSNVRKTLDARLRSFGPQFTLGVVWNIKY